jgi:hypothetical protein
MVPGFLTRGTGASPQTPVELIELGTELVRAGYQAGALLRNNVSSAALMTALAISTGSNPLVSHDLKDALSGQFLDPASVTFIRRAA